jgi:hypothetical protein
MNTWMDDIKVVVGEIWIYVLKLIASRQISAKYFLWQRTFMFRNNRKSHEQINSNPLLRNLRYVIAGRSVYVDTFAVDNHLIGIGWTK